jgi:drug/metabolite transporter (DMT)-like permease
MAAHLCINRALKLADAATVAPFQYTLLFWAVVFGFIVFGDIPRPAMSIGAAIIVAAGLFIFFRQRRSRAPLKAGQAPRPPASASRGGRQSQGERRP